MIALLAFISIVLDGPSTAVDQGDAAFIGIRYEESIEKYQQALVERVDADILWRLARVCVCQGEVLPPDDGLRLFRQAEKYARQCIALDSSRSEGYTWLAAALGYIALQASMTEQVALTREIETCALKSLSMNSRDDVAASILGSMYRALGNAGWIKKSLAEVFVGDLPEGGYEEAREFLLKAIDIAPEVMRHQYELGILYIDMDRPDEARQVLRRARTLPIRTAIDRERLVAIDERLRSLDSP